MNRSSGCLWRADLAAAALAMLAGVVSAQPTLTSLGSGTPLTVTNKIGGINYIGGQAASAGAARWSLNGATLTAADLGGTSGGYLSADATASTGTFANTGPSIFGNSASTVSPAYNTAVTLTASTTQPATTEMAGRWWSSATNSWRSMGGLPITRSLHVFGSGSSGTSTFLTPNAISGNGRFVVGLGYISTFNTAGTSVSANSFRWRAWVWDSQGNGGAGSMTVLPTPHKTTSGQTALFRTGNAYAVSNDGRVIAGATEHNTSVTPTADADGGRFAVWIYNSSTSQYVMSYLNTGTDASGFPKYMSSTPSSLAMNADGTIIVARGPDGITKWTWNGTDFGAPQVLGNNLTRAASWLPLSVTSCGVPPALGGSLAMSNDGNTIVGSAVYSTCGSFMSGGFIWTSADGVFTDWYDYNVALGTPGCSTGGFYGPTGDNGVPGLGLPVLGYPTGISADGTAIVGFQGGTQRIPGAPPWIWLASGGPSCVGPSIALQPTAQTFNACSSSAILNVAASGTGPMTYQWYKDGAPLADGVTTQGSTISGATSYQLRINSPLTPADVGNYYAVVTGQCGSPAQTNTVSVSLDSAFPAAANDTCATAQTVSAGTNVLGTGQSPCGAYVADPFGTFSACSNTSVKADRWFSFTPATSGNYRLDTCGSGYDTLISIFDGCGGTELACNNDYNTGPSTGCTSNRSRIGSIALVGGQTYKIRIAAPSAAFLSSTYVMNLSITTAPVVASNNTCDTALNAAVGTNNFDTTESTNDTIVTCATAASRDVWFKFTAGGRGAARFATCPGTTYNTVLTVFDGCFGNEVSCNDNANLTGCSTQSVISGLQMLAGQTVYIRIGGNSTTAFGAGVLTVDYTCYADFNQDGGVDGSDIGPFFDLWSSGGC